MTPRRRAARRTRAIADRYQCRRIELRGKSCEMNLQRRGDKDVVSQRIDRYGVRQHGAHHRRLIRAGGGFDAGQRKASGIRHRDSVGRGNEMMPHRLHSGIRRETRAIERRHAMLARTRKGVGGRQLCFRKARLQPSCWPSLNSARNSRYGRSVWPSASALSRWLRPANIASGSGNRAKGAFTTSPIGIGSCPGARNSVIKEPHEPHGPRDVGVRSDEDLTSDTDLSSDQT